MPLDYADFAHLYQGNGVEEREARVQFDALSDLLDCLVRFFWRDGADGAKLGISLQGILQTEEGRVESRSSATVKFNEAASNDEARKEEP